MRKLLVYIVVIFLFICGINQSNAASSYCLVNSDTKIETAQEAVFYNNDINTDDNFIISNFSNSLDFIFSNQGYGSAENNIFDIKDIFISKYNNLKTNNVSDEYLLSFSSNPRAP